MPMLAISFEYTGFHGRPRLSSNILMSVKRRLGRSNWDDKVLQHHKALRIPARSGPDIQGISLVTVY